MFPVQTIIGSVLVGLSVSQACQGQVVQGIDFRTVVAPSAVHILESARLREQLNLEGDTERDLDDLLAGWKAAYLDKKKLMDRLPPDDQVSRRGWPPSRDRDLSNSIDALLDDSQYERFHKIAELWQGGPVRSWNAFELDRRGELALTSTQHQRLHELNVRWVLTALPCFQGPHGLSRDSGQRNRTSATIDRLEAMADLARNFKPLRDEAWERILSPQQATRWRQLELQVMLGKNDFRVFLDDYGTTESERRQSGTYFDYIIPYFKAPSEVIDWTPQQQEAVRATISKYKAEPPIIDTADLKVPQTDWKVVIQASHQRLRKYLVEIEALMTSEQEERWREMIGKPYSAQAQTLFQ